MEKACFVDAKGREWHPKITSRVLMNFEQWSGIGVFDAFFDSDKDAGSSTIKRIFGKVGNLTFILYEACKLPYAGSYSVRDANGKEIGYEDFCEAIEPQNMHQMIEAVQASLVQFNPEKKDVGGAEVASGTHPTGRGAGAMSLKPPR